jgi:sorbitol-6-phosphate 2-dehydrogenase
MADGAARAAWWPGATLDEARSRAASGSVEPWRAAPRGAASREGPAAGGRELDSGARGEVVRGRVALVTGGAQGFGEQIVRGLAASGALVFVADMNAAGAETLCAALNAEAGSTVALPVAVNVADEASVAAAFRASAAAAGGLDLVVSNAGVLKAGSVLEQDAAVFRFVTEVNYTGFFLVAKQAGLLLRRQSRTAPAWRTDIVQVNSKSGLQGSNRNGAYAGSKFGGLGLVQSFALELVEFGVKVNAICPGNFFDGPLWSDPKDGLFAQYLRSGKVKGAKSVADVKAFYEAKVPMGRGCEGRDVMRALYYLVEQDYETGQALPVTGGQVMLA